MAATNETSSPEWNRGWYQDDLTEINGPIRKLLESYSKLPSSEVVKHINNIRERGFTANPYPCIGLYRFINLTLLSHPLYDTILERLSAPSATYLDVGCCFGQDLRQLVQDGIPSDRLIGLDVSQALMDLGYDLFLDRETIRSRFVIADVFKGAEQGPVWTDLEKRGVDVMHCSAFLHLFTLEDQISAAKNLARLMKQDGMIVGRQMGSVKPGNVAAVRNQTLSYRHNVDTLKDMWQKVGEATQTQWKVEGTMDMVGVNIRSPVENEDSRRLLFTVTRTG
ncbi:hypothetical protein F5Y11DRAFT_293717 [Daldinia sp. FL1419]|nr:hypothetical protein F5Y11DRAFT_293717 [Daldinia sp. FL1419]